MSYITIIRFCVVAISIVVLTCIFKIIKIQDLCKEEFEQPFAPKLRGPVLGSSSYPTFTDLKFPDNGKTITLNFFRSLIDFNGVSAISFGDDNNLPSIKSSLSSFEMKTITFSKNSETYLRVPTTDSGSIGFAPFIHDKPNIKPKVSRNNAPSPVKSSSIPSPANSPSPFKTITSPSPSEAPTRSTFKYYGHGIITTPSPTNPYTPSPTIPYTPSPSNPVTPSPSNPYTPSPSNPYTPSPSNPYTPSPTNPYTPSPSNPYTPSPTNPFNPSPSNPFTLSPSNPFTSSLPICSKKLSSSPTPSSNAQTPSSKAPSFKGPLSKGPSSKGPSSKNCVPSHSSHALSLIGMKGNIITGIRVWYNNFEIGGMQMIYEK